MKNEWADMDPQCFEDAVRMTAMRIADVVITKQRDYGPRNILDFGDFGVLVRLNDKVCRLRNLMSVENPNHEGLDDSWLDVVGYGLIGVMVREGTFALPMRGDDEEVGQGAASDTGHTSGTVDWVSKATV